MELSLGCGKNCNFCHIMLLEKFRDSGWLSSRDVLYLDVLDLVARDATIGGRTRQLEGEAMVGGKGRDIWGQVTMVPRNIDVCSSDLFSVKYELILDSLVYVLR